MTMIQDKLPFLLARICQSEEVIQNADIRLFDAAMLDSFGVVELLLACEEEFGLRVPLSSFDREEWATPRLIALRLEEFQ